jgi:hypothetical protein
MPHGHQIYKQLDTYFLTLTVVQWVDLSALLDVVKVSLRLENPLIYRQIAFTQPEAAQMKYRNPR